MNSSLNKSNLNFELILFKLALIHTIKVMDIESLDSSQNNLIFSPKFENMNSLWNLNFNS
jgi:hypothetical protein